MEALATENLNFKEAAKRWTNGQSVWSVEMGGIGPGYEQCIQTIIFEALSKWPKETFDLDVDGKTYPTAFNEWFEPIVSDLDKSFGFSGAQVGAAKTVVWQFLKYGYAEMMAKAPKDRKILVSRKFPSVEEKAKH
jgi:hypothetical protein